MKIFSIKELYRLSKHIDSLIDQAAGELLYRQSWSTVVETHQRSKFTKNLNDDEVKTQPIKQMGELSFMKNLINHLRKEQHLVLQTITEAKQNTVVDGLAMDIDQAIQIAKTNRKVVSWYQSLLSNHQPSSTERTMSGQTMSENGIVDYKYPVMVEQTLNYDPNQARREMKEYAAEAEDISLKVDELMSAKLWELPAMISINDSLEDIMAEIESTERSIFT